MTILLQWEPKLPGRNAQHKETSAQNVEPIKYEHSFNKNIVTYFIGPENVVSSVKWIQLININPRKEYNLGLNSK